MEAVPVEESDEMTGGGILMALYYTRIPLREIEQTLRRMLDAWGL